MLQYLYLISLFKGRTVSPHLGWDLLCTKLLLVETSDMIMAPVPLAVDD